MNANTETVRETKKRDPHPVGGPEWRDMMDRKSTTGPYMLDNEGAVFLACSGYPLYVTKESILNAKPNERCLDEDGVPSVMMLWLKGHARPTAVRSTWEEFQAWRFNLHAD